MSSTSVRDKVLVYCSEASPQSFNPQLVTSGPTFDASSRQIYNRLVEFEPGGTQLKQSLATHWEISGDGKEYTFYLRKDVTFQTTDQFVPTRHFNADDVLFSFQRQWKKNHPYHRVSPLQFRYFGAMGLNELILNIEKLDIYKVKFTLKNPDAPFLATLAMDFASILSAEYAAHLIRTGQPQLIDNKPVGTGPFQLVRYQPDAFIRYKPHPTYWKGKEKLEGLVFAITPDPSLRFARLIAGECDIMAKPLPIQIDAASQYPGLITLSEAGSNVSFLAMNTTKKPFDQHKVRLAMNYAINKSSILKIVYGGTAEEAINPIPPLIWSYDNKTEPVPYSSLIAKQLLIEAGYPDGFKMDLWAMPVQRTYNPNAIKMAELIQHDLEKVGIKVSIISYEFGTFLEKIKSGEHQAALLGWIGDNGDPDNYFSSTLSCAAARSGNNGAFWCDEKFDSLIQQAGEKSDIDVRTELYLKAQRRFNQQKPWVPIAHARQFILLNKKVNNLQLVPTDGMYFSGVTLSAAEAETPLPGVE
ncbi:MAG: ABC transporter substrate-binding protein [Kangiellaceae bacterium]|nr:ABC transporter substrate-binding protein [Kangiellaceae bacterium]